MKRTILSLLSASVLLASLYGCQHEPNSTASPRHVATQNTASAGTEISLEQATAWTQAYRNQHPNGLRSVAYSAQGIRNLLAQDGCTGIRIYNATNDEGEDVFVLVGIDAAGHDQTDKSLFDGSPRCPKWCAVSVLAGDLSAMEAATAPLALPLTQEQAVRWTGTYQLSHPGQPRAAFYDTAVLEMLLQQTGNTGIRVYQALADNGTPTFVLAGIDGNYQDQTGLGHLLFANGLPCLSDACSPGSILVH